MHTFSTWLGVIGVVMILVIYALLQFQRVSQYSVSYSMVNLVGSIFILFSLFFAWNLPAVLMEVVWILVSVYGLIKAYERLDKMRGGQQ